MASKLASTLYFNLQSCEQMSSCGAIDFKQFVILFLFQVKTIPMKHRLEK